MVTIEKNGNDAVFEIIGWHKLWAFKSQLVIPLTHIEAVHQNKESTVGWKGWRFPGTSFFSLITAGTFYKNGSKIFWDVVNMEKCIIVELKNETYNKLIIEVENPKDAIRILKN